MRGIIKDMDSKDDLEEIKNAVLVYCEKCKPDLIPQTLDFGFIEVQYCPHVNILKRTYTPKWKSIYAIEKIKND